VYPEEEPDGISPDCRNNAACRLYKTIKRTLRFRVAGKAQRLEGGRKAVQFGERLKFMTRATLKNLAALGSAITLAFLLGASCATAQGKGDKLPKAGQAPAQAKAPVPAEQSRALWYKLCSDLPVREPAKPGEPPKQQKPEEMKKVAVCLTQADVRDNVTAMLVAKLVVRQIAGQANPQILVMLPLQSALPPGALVKLDDKDPLRLPYTACDQGGCYAETNIEPAMLDQMKTGKQISFAGMDITGRTLNVPLPLEGFAKAIDGAPVPQEKYIEEQRRFAELIKARLAELRKQQEQAAQSSQNTQPAAAAAAAPAPASPPKKGK
jgi:invasion protein IalB